MITSVFLCIIHETMKYKTQNKEILQINQWITILAFETIKTLNQFDLQHPEVLRVYRVLNQAIMYQQKILNLSLWFHEAAEISKNIPYNQDELKRYIDELRYRLVMIADIYGYRSSKTLLYSQYLDQFIVAFHKKEMEKIQDEHS